MTDQLEFDVESLLALFDHTAVQHAGLRALRAAIAAQLDCLELAADLDWADDLLADIRAADLETQA